jgi:hypothetical protein
MSVLPGCRRMGESEMPTGWASRGGAVLRLGEASADCEGRCKDAGTEQSEGGGLRDGRGRGSAAIGEGGILADGEGVEVLEGGRGEGECGVGAVELDDAVAFVAADAASGPGNGVGVGVDDAGGDEQGRGCSDEVAHELHRTPSIDCLNCLGGAWLVAGVG